MHVSHLCAVRVLKPALLAAVLFFGGCAKQPQGTVQDLRYRWVSLPDGAKIRVELAIRPEDQLRGMQFREYLAQDQGMLFIHQSEGYYPYWMHQVKIPLDIIWMDKNRHIVQIAHRVPPCQTQPSLCPNYGGGFLARFVLEINAGEADKHNLGPGMALDFSY